MSGIRTLDDLRQRCFVDDLTGCWLWRGATTGQGQPCAWYSPLGKATSVGAIIGHIRTGAKPRRGFVWTCTCETRFCANPAHRVESYSGARLDTRDRSNSGLTRARKARGQKGKLCHVKAADIRSSAEPLRVLAERHGVSLSTCSRIRRGEMWRLGAPAASVFAWGGS